MRIKGVFIIGIDTEIGKTTISGGLGNLLFRKGIKIGVMKPFATGIKTYSKDFKSHDAKILKEASSSKDNDDIINPYFYSIPTAPYLAKKILKVNEDIDVEEILSKYKEIEKRHEFTIVEGIGGLMVPLSKNFFVADLASIINVPVILIMSNKIGSVNHIIMTYRLAMFYKLKIKGIIINNKWKFSNPLLKLINNNLQSIVEEMTGAKVLATIPYLKEPSFKKIANILEKTDIIKQLENE
ncbi:MAG TPA: dethiobiotin synthase [Nitrososphaeraceae archaeon]|jgi:dethiobiotin synthetase|nr:dethiobiotin synthase [Nitrososphaeraceae archaeon]